MATLEDKIRSLLDEGDDNDSFFFDHTRPASTRPPPLIDIYTRSPSVSLTTGSPKLTPRQTKALLARLCAAPKPAPPAPLPSAPVRLMNPNSVRMTEGLEPIRVRAAKLLKAKERNREQQLREKETSERDSLTARPLINERSRQIAERLSPVERERIVAQRKQILLDEAREKENADCRFQPRINPSSARRVNESVSVVDRLVQDVEARRLRNERQQREWEEIAMAECRDTPEISNVAKSMFRDGSVAPVHQRLYPRQSVATALPADTTSVQKQSAVSFREFLTRNGLLAQPARQPSDSNVSSNTGRRRSVDIRTPFQDASVNAGGRRRSIDVSRATPFEEVSVDDSFFPPPPSFRARTADSSVANRGVSEFTLSPPPVLPVARSLRHPGLDLSTIFAFTKR